MAKKKRIDECNSCGGEHRVPACTATDAEKAAWAAKRSGGGAKGKGKEHSVGGIGDNNVNEVGKDEFMEQARRSAEGTPQDPDKTVTKSENALVENNLARMMKNLNKIVPPNEFPPRSAFSTLGREVILRTNFLHMKPQKDLVLYRYAVHVVPEQNHARRTRRLIELFIRDRLGPLGYDNLATDGRSTIIATKKIELGPTNRESYAPFNYYELEEQPDARATSRAAKDHPTVSIEYTGTLSVQNLINYLNSHDGQSRCAGKEEILQALNIVMSRYPYHANGVVTLKANNKFFSTVGAARELGGGLQALPGFFTSVRTSTTRLLLNVNCITAAFYRPGPLTELMSGYGTGDLIKLDGFLKGVRLQLTHLGKSKVIYGLCKKTGPGGALGANAQEFKFDWAEKEGGPKKRVNVVQYYKAHYKEVITKPLELLVNVGNAKNPMGVPPELCMVLPGQICNSKLSGDQTKNMIEAAARAPVKNVALISRDGVNTMGLAETAGPRSFGLSVAPEMLTVLGRLLAHPKILYSGDKIPKMFAGSWSLVERDRLKNVHNKFCSPRRLSNWTYVQIRFADKHVPRVTALTVIEALVNQMNLCGMNSNSPYTNLQQNPGHMITIPRAGYKDRIRSYLEAVQSKQVGFIVILLPEKNTALYDTIKTILDSDLGILNICMDMTNRGAAAGDGGYYANVAAKLNLKLGGVNHKVGDRGLGLIEDGKTMVLGIDVTHPSPKSHDMSPSIAACVANVDRVCGQWYGSVRSQLARTEMVDDLEDMVVERFAVWRAKNQGHLPDRIIVYRDGVSEGQYAEVLETEVAAIRRAWVRVYGPRGKAPKLSVIVVGKRHHTRFYPASTRKEDLSKTGNSIPGLVVDRGVTSERYWDFYLQAHDGIKGTARPGHYIVILDDIGLKVDGLQEMTHNLCYMWSRATKSVSLCPPAYYADILCTRARCYLQESDGNIRQWTGPHALIKDKMFFV